MPLEEFGNVLGGKDSKGSGPRGTFIAWHCAVREMQPDSLYNFLAGRVADDATFHPPTYFPPWKGREELLMLVTAAGEVFGESFAYGRQWLSPDGKEWCLEFSATIGSKKLQGVDMVSLDESGKITDFKVLARPPSAVAALKDEMVKKVPPRLAALKVKQAAGRFFGK